MARTNRKDVPPPATSVDALDDLDLDGMFEGGDDSLFEGLDIDLDGMGDITGALDGRRDGQAVSEDLDAMQFDLLGPGEQGALKSSPRRRKTKRKTKTPPPLEEEYTEQPSPSKKKKRTSKSTKRSKSKSNQRDEPPSPSGSSTSSRSRSKSKTAGTMPPPLPRGSAGALGMVAAAGQFGGRTQKRSGYNLPLQRSTSDRQKTKAKTAASRPGPVVSPGSKTKGRTSSASSLSSRGSTTRQQLEEDLIETGQESTFCGILPSSTLFYPFMPSLPPEVSMKKCNKLYPCLDNICSTLNSQSSINANTPNLPPSDSAVESDALFRLMFADFDHHQTGSSDSSSSHMLRRATLTSALSSVRTSVSHMDKSRLFSELHSVCGLIKRQHGFVTQNMENMKHWCRENFNEQDYAAVFGSVASTAVASKKRKSLTDVRTGQLLYGPNLRGLTGAVLKVKVKCNGFKEPKMSAVLVAKLPGTTPPVAIAMRPPRVIAPAPKIEATKKKRKVVSGSVAIAEKPASSPAVVAEVDEEVSSYVGSNPSQRRESLIEAVDMQAWRLERKYIEATESRKASALRQEAELQKVVEDDDILLVNTATLWKWVAKSTYFADYTEEDIDEVLHCAWQPELNNRKLCGTDVSPVHVMQKPKTRTTEDSNDAGKKGKAPMVSVKSLFDRLQSLLVDEGSDDETEDDDVDFLNDLEGLPAVESNGKSLADSEKEEDTILDLSKLNLEERTFIQLRSIGLVDSPFLPSPHPVLIEEDESQSDDGEESRHSETHIRKEHTTADEEDNLDDVIQAMQCDLSRLQRLNNSRTAVLQCAAREHLAAMRQSKKKEEERTQQITKYNLLLKKQKEVKRSARQKTVKKDEDWVPW